MKGLKQHERDLSAAEESARVSKWLLAITNHKAQGHLQVPVSPLGEVQWSRNQRMWQFGTQRGCAHNRATALKAA